jgi:ABC-type branched-subunit amino acid transport system substrate-binding protein
MRPLRVGACLSLSGRYRRFGVQAARGLEAWRDLDGGSELIVEDDASDARRLGARLRDLAGRCDLLLGPYSTGLTRAASALLPELDHLLWNHGGSGDDVQAAAPGRLVSVPAPASRYADPFVRLLAGLPERAPLWIVAGRGSFGRQVADGAAALAARLGLEAVRGGPDRLPAGAAPPAWDLFSAGAFEDDLAVVTRALRLPQPPRTLCSVAAGVREFAELVVEHQGIYGIAQWWPGSKEGGGPELGPTEGAFLERYAGPTGKSPDYPAVQAAAGAVLAAHCARVAGELTGEALWQAAAALDTTTLFGGFRIDPVTGAQVKHETTLVRWTEDEPIAV